MAVFRISSRQLGFVELDASNWLVALGEGLGRLGVVDALDRIACEVLPNGTILVRDVRRGHGYIVQPLLGDEETQEWAPDEDTQERPAPSALDLGLARRLEEGIAAVARAEGPLAAAQAALDAAVGLVPCESGALLLEQPDGTLRFVYATGPEAGKVTGRTLPENTGVAGFSVNHGVALTVNEAYDDDRFYRGVDIWTGYRTRSIVCVPIASDTRVFGCLELLNSPDARGFAKEVLADLARLTDALAARL